MPSFVAPDPARPLILTCGEPAGIGPEIASRLIGPDLPPFLWLGDPRHLPEGTDWVAHEDPFAPLPEGRLAVLPHRFAGLATPGQPDPANARGVIEVIARAVDLVATGAASGICTLPLHKKALKDGAGFAFPGHTEYLADLAGGCDVAMMLASTSVSPPCRTVPATIHIALQDVADQLTPQRLEAQIRLTHTALRRDFGIAAPRIAVAGLNPHAGEGGAMGRAEIDWMAPLCARLRDEGLDVAGPLPADTMFHAPARARYDAAVCAYHDQALIPIKTLDFAGGVNVTLGLPFVRTSPDHGTGFDIAGQGRAETSSTRAALALARQMVLARAASEAKT